MDVEGGSRRSNKEADYWAVSKSVEWQRSSQRVLQRQIIGSFSTHCNMGDVWAMGRSSRAADVPRGNLSTHRRQLMLLFNVRNFFAGSDKLCRRNGSKVVKCPAVVFILKTKQSQALYESPKGGVDPACLTFLQEQR